MKFGIVFGNVVLRTRVGFGFGFKVSADSPPQTYLHLTSLQAFKESLNQSVFYLVLQLIEEVIVKFRAYVI